MMAIEFSSLFTLWFVILLCQSEKITGNVIENKMRNVRFRFPKFRYVRYVKPAKVIIIRSIPMSTPTPLQDYNTYKGFVQPHPFQRTTDNVLFKNIVGNGVYSFKSSDSVPFRASQLFDRDEQLYKTENSEEDKMGMKEYQNIQSNPTDAPKIDYSRWPTNIEIVGSISYALPTETITYHPIEFSKEYFIDDVAPPLKLYHEEGEHTEIQQITKQKGNDENTEIKNDIEDVTSTSTTQYRYENRTPIYFQDDNDNDETKNGDKYVEYDSDSNISHDNHTSKNIET